jgi:hypothetical protein
MKLFKYLEDIEKQIRGWLPKDPNTVNAQTASQRGAKWPIIAGYGVGFGVSEGILWIAYLLGLYKNQTRFPSFFISQILIVACALVSVVIAVWLTRKLQKSQQGSFDREK